MKNRKMPGYPYPIRSFDNFFSDEHWRVLNQCAKKVAARFGNRVEVGDLITEGWLGYARRMKDLRRCHGFVYKMMCKWARAWLNHTLESLDGPAKTVDRNFSVPTVELKTSEDAEFTELELNKRMSRMNQRDKDVVKFYLQTGSMKDVAKKTHLSYERVRQILRKVAA